MAASQQPGSAKQPNMPKRNKTTKPKRANRHSDETKRSPKITDWFLPSPKTPAPKHDAGQTKEQHSKKKTNCDDSEVMPSVRRGSRKRKKRFDVESSERRDAKSPKKLQITTEGNVTPKKRRATSPKKSKPKKSKTTAEGNVTPSTSSRKSEKLKATEEQNNNHTLDCYVKYGVNLPTFAQIKKDHEDLQVYNEKVNRALDAVRAVKLSDWSDGLNMEREELPMLSCDLLTPLEVKDYFQRFLPHLERIVDGSEYNERHEMFFNGGYNRYVLTYNTSMVTFTRQQKQQLADLCTQHFDGYGIVEHNKYYFMVLLPELCLRIFMDVHNMEHGDAVDYLDKRPADDVF